MPADPKIDLEGYRTILCVLEDDARRTEAACDRVADLLVACWRVTVAVIPAHPSPWLTLAPVDPEINRLELIGRAEHLARHLCRQLSSTVCATHLVLENPRWPDLEHLARVHNDELIVLCLSRRRSRRRLKPPSARALRLGSADTGPVVRWIDAVTLARSQASTA